MDRSAGSSVGFENVHPAFSEALIDDAPIERVATGFRFTEGPVWRGDHLLFSDIPNSRIVRWRALPEGPEVTTFRTPSGQSNGHTLDRTGRLVSCEHATRRVTRTEMDGSVIVLAERHQGRRLNSPNDVVVRSDGAIFFTDPPYGLGRDEAGKECECNGVYRLDPDGALTCLVEDFDRPNGLAFSPDERTLYIDDTRRNHIRAFDVDAAGKLHGDTVFAELRADERGGADGMKVDADGRVWCTGPGGVWVFAPAGTYLGRLRLPEIPANLAFGDADWCTLYLTAQTSLYRVRLRTPGVPVGRLD